MGRVVFSTISPPRILSALVSHLARFFGGYAFTRCELNRPRSSERHCKSFLTYPRFAATLSPMAQRRSTKHDPIRRTGLAWPPAPRIQNELLKLGIEVSQPHDPRARASAPPSSLPDLASFLGHMTEMVAVNMFMVPLGGLSASVAINDLNQRDRTLFLYAVERV